MRGSRALHVGSLPLGGGAPVSVQSMTNTDTRNAETTLAQVRALAAAGAVLLCMPLVQTLGQARNHVVVPEKVVKMNVAHAQLPQHGEQLLEPVCQ